MTAQEWLVKFAKDAGVGAPSGEEMEKLLKLAAIAAHASERTAAPVACYLARNLDHAHTQLGRPDLSLLLHALDRD